MQIQRIEQDFSVCQAVDLSGVDFGDAFCFVGKTDEELSLVCQTSAVPANVLRRDDGWKAFRIVGVLDFSLIGILAKISTLLADNGVGIFAVSTYNTDYILTRAAHYEKALAVLAEAGYPLVAAPCAPSQNG